MFSWLNRVVRSVRQRLLQARSRHIQLTSDGAWCWFADPRAVKYVGAHGCLYAGWVSSDGDIVVTQYNGEVESFVSHVVRRRLDRNDHANPALIVAPDGRITVFYSSHNGHAMFSRTTLRPEDVSEWSSESELKLNTGQFGRDTYTYPNPVQLTHEKDRLFLFWRGDHWKPTLASSQDGGATWSTARILVMRSDADESNRPYLKVAGNGLDTIHMAFTDGHPQVEESNSIYYICYQGGRFLRADGTLVTLEDDLPLEPAEADIVYDAQREGARAWIWDVAYDEEGHPVLVYAVFPNQDEHYYRYARWDGHGWMNSEITFAGSWFPENLPGKRQTEPYYSGGIVLDHDDVDTVYLSRNVDGVFEIERWVTDDLGYTWVMEPVTSKSKRDNVRPFAIRNHGESGPRVMWMRLEEEYLGYRDYQASIQMSCEW